MAGSLSPVHGTPVGNHWARPFYVWYYHYYDKKERLINLTVKNYHSIAGGDISGTRRSSLTVNTSSSSSSAISFTGSKLSPEAIKAKPFQPKTTVTSTTAASSITTETSSSATSATPISVVYTATVPPPAATQSNQGKFFISLLLKPFGFVFFKLAARKGIFC